MVQSKPIIRLVGNVYGYYPQNNGVQCHIIDRTLDCIDDTRPLFVKTLFNPDLDTEQK